MPTLAASWMIGQGGLLALVPFGGGRADHVGGEAVQPVPHLLLLVVEFHGELRHDPPSSGTPECYLR